MDTIVSIDNNETKMTVELSTGNIYDELSKKVSPELDRNLLDLLSQMLKIDPNKVIIDDLNISYNNQT